MSPKQNTSVTGSPAHSSLIQAAAAAGVRIRSLGKQIPALRHPPGPRLRN